MPPKNITCEFCHQSFRKDLHAVHIRSKHKTDMGKKILKEAIDKNGGYCDLNRYLQHKNATPIYNNLDEEACYIFGVQPKYFEEKDSFGSYLSSQDNVDAHNNFIEECIASINITDLLPILDLFQLNSPEVSEMKKTHYNTVNELTKKIEKLEKDNELLERENKSLAVCCDVDVNDYEKMKSDNRYYERAMKDANTTIAKLNIKIERQETQLTDSIENNGREKLNLQSELEVLTEKYMVLKGKKSEKKQKKKENDKEKKEREKKKEKKKLKELKKKLESDSDSSDSDSESD